MAGRPSKYKKEYCKMLIEHMKHHSFESFGAIIGHPRTTLYAWAEKHPEFMNAKKVGREHLQLTQERIGRGLMSGKLKGNVASWIFYTKNVTHWRDEPDNDLEDGITGIEFVDDT